MTLICNICHGTGKFDGYPCPECGGSGRLKVSFKDWLLSKLMAGWGN